MTQECRVHHGQVQHQIPQLRDPELEMRVWLGPTFLCPTEMQISEPGDLILDLSVVDLELGCRRAEAVSDS